MSITTVLYGAAYDGKNEQTFRKCLEKIRRNEGNSCLYLVRSDVRVRQLRDLILREFSGCFYFPVSTFPDFIKTIYRKFTGTKRVIGSLEQKLLIEDILRQRKQECGTQFYFTRFRDHPGILTKVKEFITGVRRTGIASPQELAEKLKHCSGRRQQIHKELVNLFEQYVGRLRAADAIDDTGIFLDVAQQAVSGQLDIHAYITSPELLILEGYYELTLPEQQILSSLCSQFERNILTLDTPLNPYNFPAEAETPKPFRIFRDIGGYIQASGFSLRESSVSHRDTEAQRREHLSTPLKEGKTETFSEIMGICNLSERRLSVKSYRDRKEEVTEIAREIRTLCREGKITALRDVGVTFPVIEQYERLVREIFPLFGIPFTMFQGYLLASSPVVVTIFRLLQVVLDGYSREAMGKLFSSPLVQFEMTEEDRQNKFYTPLQNKFCTPVALNSDTYQHLDSLARSLGIVGGKEEWEEKLTQYHPLLTCPVDGEEITPTADCRLPTANCLLNFLSRFETEEPRPPEELIELLIEGIQRFQIPQRVLRSRQREILENDASALRAFFRFLNTLKQELRSYHSKRLHPDTLTLKEFFDLLRIAVQGESYYLPEMLADSVFIMGRLDTRQVQFAYLFFGGLVERDFPGQDEPNIFLSDQELETLGLPTYEKRFKETDHLFYLNFLNPREKIYLSHPLQEGEADLLKATYIEKIIHLQNKFCTPSQNEFCTPLQNIFTYSELYQWLGIQLSQKDISLSHPQPLLGEEKEVLRFIGTQKGKEFVANFLDGLQAQRVRTSKEPGHFDGVLASHWSKSLLRRRYSKHIYSASEFDQYVRCPIKYFFRRVIRLESLREITAEISALDIGTLLHRILYRFYTKQNKFCTPLQNEFCTPGQADRQFLQKRTDKEQWIREANIRMERIVREELNLYNFSGVFWDRFTESLLAGLTKKGVQNLFCKGVQDLSCKQGLLATFIGLEANDTDKVMPCYLNAHFGMPAFSEDKQNKFCTPLQTKVCTPEVGYVLSVNPFQLREKDTDGKVVTIKIRGEIDRIDLEPVSDKKTCRVVIYDYKTGSIPSVQKIKDGLSFQLPLYLLAVRKFLGEDYEVVAGGFYQLKSPNDIGKKGYFGSKEYSEQRYFKGSTRSLFDTHEEFLRMQEEYKTRAVRAAQVIKEGRFHPTILGTQNAGCSYCEYNQICRVDHQRMKNLAS